MHEIKMPQMGQSVEEASIVQWLKKEGDTIKQGDVLFTIQTDKAEVECESPATGVLRKILLQPDVMVPVMTVVALVGDVNEPIPDLGQSPAAAPAATSASAEPQAAPAKVEASASVSAAASAGSRGAVSPRAKMRANELGVDVGSVPGTGVGGRVMEADVVAFAAQHPAVKATPTAKRVAETAGVALGSVQGTGPSGKIMKDDVLKAAKPAVSAALPAGTATEDGQRITLTPMRRIIAQRMVESKFSAPHYYVTIEVDMSAAQAYRKQITGLKATVNDLVLRATVLALRAHPGVNVRWEGDAYTLLNDVNLGVAVAIPNGLIVPVVKKAQDLSLEGLSRQVKTLVDKARAGKLLPDEYVGNSFTVTNIGVYGIDEFFAIINQPDSAILAVGAMKDRVVAIDGGIHIRPIMKLTLSADHRVIDGAVAAPFVANIKEILEKAQF